MESSANKDSRSTHQNTKIYDQPLSDTLDISLISSFSSKCSKYISHSTTNSKPIFNENDSYQKAYYYLLLLYYNSYVHEIPKQYSDHIIKTQFQEKWGQITNTLIHTAIYIKFRLGPKKYLFSIFFSYLVTFLFIGKLSIDHQYKVRAQSFNDLYANKSLVEIDAELRLQIVKNNI